MRLGAGSPESGQVGALELKTVLDTLQVGILLFNQRCEVVLANRSADAVINSRDWLWLADRKLKCNAAENADIQRRILASIQQRNSEPDALMVLNCAASDDFLLLGFTPVESGAHQQTTLCILVDPRNEQRPDISLFKSLYSLTDAEVDITSMIASGIDYGEIAKQRSVAVTTIRSFTKSIFKKLGVSSRAGVVYKTQTTMLPFNMLNRQ